MAKRSAIEGLPEDVRRWLDRALSSRGFAQYQMLEQHLREKGHAISKSAIHRYGQKLERRLAAVKASTEAMRMLDEAAGDEQDSRSSGLMALIQTEMFEAIVNIQEATDEDIDPAERVKMLSTASRNIATLTRSSINLKRFQSEARKEAADKVMAAAEKALNEEVDRAAVLKRIREEVYGITE